MRNHLLSRILCVILPAALALSSCADDTPEAKARKLLKQMTLHEKCLQLQNRSIGSVDDFEAVFGGESVGTVHNLYLEPDDCRFLMDSLQRYMRSRTRLGIPVIPCVEGVQGVLQNGCTLFPCPLAQGSTFNPDLVREATSVMAREAAYMGFHQILSPVLDIARDLRWGRIEETYGEDPYLIAEMGTAFVSGYQDGTDISCMPKHFVAHGTPTGGLNCASVAGGERDLYALYLYPFRKVISRTRPLAVMSCYSAYDGVAVTGSYRYMTELLRGELGFDGYVYSDWGSVERLYNFHFCAPTPEAAAAQGLKAGVDLNIDGTCATLEQQVLSGELEEKYIDQAVLRILTAKFRMGLFEDKPLPDTVRVRSAAHVEASRRVAEESAVLLLNNGILPLSGRKRIAVVGPNAADPVFGDYSWTGAHPTEGVSLLDGLRQACGDGVSIGYAQGCDHWSQDRSGFAEAVRLAAASDVVIAAVGTRSTYLGRTTDRSTAGEGFDLSSLDLPGSQQALLEALSATGKPLVVVLISGKPLAIPWVRDHADALLVQWYGGERQGEVLADILTGALNPSGRLNVSFPRSTGATPCYYNYYPTDKDYMGNTGGTPDAPADRYIFESCYALWPFGYGLSYSHFTYSDFACEPDGDAVRISVNVTNDSAVPGKEVVQLYVRDCVSSVATPVRQLKAFRKVAVGAGETVPVILSVPVDELGLYDEAMRYVVEPGDFEFMVGSSSEDILFSKTIRIDR